MLVTIELLEGNKIAGTNWVIEHNIDLFEDGEKVIFIRPYTRIADTRYYEPTVHKLGKFEFHPVGYILDSAKGAVRIYKEGGTEPIIIAEDYFPTAWVKDVSLHINDIKDYVFKLPHCWEIMEQVPNSAPMNVGTTPTGSIEVANNDYTIHTDYASEYTKVVPKILNKKAEEVLHNMYDNYGPVQFCGVLDLVNLEFYCYDVFSPKDYRFVPFAEKYNILQQFPLIKQPKILYNNVSFEELGIRNLQQLYKFCEGKKLLFRDSDHRFHFYT